MTSVPHEPSGLGWLSAVMPVHHGVGALDRTLASLVGQRFQQWELLAVDDASTDETAARLAEWERRDARIRVLRSERRIGPGAARNLGIRHSKGGTIVHLDCGAELSPEHFARVAQGTDRADVILSGYDPCVWNRDRYATVRADADADAWLNRLFLHRGGLALPLALAHRRSLIDDVGGVNEYVPWDEIGDLWKRLARRGASFLYLPNNCGTYPLSVPDEGVRCTTLEHQRRHAQKNHRDGMPLYYDAAATCRNRGPVQRIAYAGCASIIDFSNGASVATMDTLQALSRAGFECQAFCSNLGDVKAEAPLEEILASLGHKFSLAPSRCAQRTAHVLYTRWKRVPVTVVQYRSAPYSQVAPEDVFATFRFFDRFLLEYRPGAVLTYGADPISLGMMALAKRRDVPVVFAIHNFAYRNQSHFLATDYCVVPSNFAREFYWREVGVSALALPNPVDWGRVRAPSPDPRFLTFVNPSRNKGVYPFARIAEELYRRRTDIPLLVVEARGTRHTLGACWPDGRVPPNVTIMGNTPDPRRFWCRTRICLVPSLWWENQPAVVYEAMINGIPVVGSDRGGIPEALGDAGFALPLPERLTPRSEVLPTADEVEPWVDTIIRLWDDRALYREQSEKSLKEARRWHPDVLGPLYAAFYSNAEPQPGPPILPR